MNRKPLCKWAVSRLAVFTSAALAVAAVSPMASAHVIPWRDGMPRVTGFGTCAKGPCLKRTDFSPSVPHVHVRSAGVESIVMCTGLARKPNVCASPARHP